MTVYKRAGTRFFWIGYTAHGRRYLESSRTTNKRAAAAREAEILRSIELGTWRPPGHQLDTRPTVSSYAATWTARRAAAGVRTASNEASRLRDYVLPILGTVALEDLRRPAIASWLRGVEQTTSAATGMRLSPRTVLHCYSVLRTMLSDAVADELIIASPATLRTRKGELPQKRDADPRWRDAAIYTRTELEALVGDVRVPLDRRVYYALLGLAGLRSSEAAGMRWRDYDPRAEPLGRLLVATQITADRQERETKTALPRRVPVHPVLAELLEVWRSDGWPKWWGRHPGPEDLVVPSRAGTDEARSGSKARERLLDDLARLGFRTTGRARHALRATFVTLATEDGAVPSILDLVVWAKPSAVRAGYQRFPWAALCGEIVKLRVELKSGAVVSLGFGAGGKPIPLQSPLQSSETASFLGKKHRGGGIRTRQPAEEDCGKVAIGAEGGDRDGARIHGDPGGRKQGPKQKRYINRRSEQ